MTSAQLSTVLPDQPSIKMSPTLPYNPHLVEVSLSNLDAQYLPRKGLYAVFPAYNDEIVIGSLVLRTKQYADRVIVVDDGSSDRTAEVAKLAGAEVIRLEHTTGKAYAVLLGLRQALETGCAVAVILDADGHHDPKEIPRLAGLVFDGQADLVIGSRYPDKTGIVPVKQKIKQLMLQLPADTPADLIPADPLSGFMAFSRGALEHLDFPFEKTRFHQNLIKQFLLKNLSIKEVAITDHPGNLPKTGWDYSPTVIAALPAFNEETFLAKNIPLIKSYVDMVIIVDDGSTDATANISQQMGAYVVKHPENRGYGSALQTIFSTARELNVDALVIMDADGQHNPADIEKVLEPLLQGADVVNGSRFMDKTTNTIPHYRKVGMKVLDTATTTAGVKKGTDTQSGFRAYGKKAISAISLSGQGMSAGSEILIQISNKKLRLVEVPINVRYDIQDTSTQNPLSHGVSVLYDIIILISCLRPLPAFGIPGLILVFLGIGAGYMAFSEYYLTSKFPFGLSMMSEMLLILGLLMGVSALILNAVIVIVKEHSNK
jgi:glycosyltransferase involved in cell wall biosynthesis